MKTNYDETNKVKMYNYLGEIIPPSLSEKSASEENEKSESSLQTILQCVSLKFKSLSHQAKSRHCSTVDKPECLYTAETITSKRLTEIDNKETKFLRKILGLRQILKMNLSFIWEHKSSFK